MSGGLFNLFQMSQQEEDVLSLEDSGSECFETGEAGSSADEMEDCLAAASEGVAVAEFTGPPSSKVPSGDDRFSGLKGREDHHKSRRRGLVGFLYLGQCLSSV